MSSPYAAGDFDTVILAGGGAARMGGADKPGLAVSGMPMLVSVAQAAAAAGTKRLIIVGPPRPGAVQAGLAVLATQRPRWLVYVLEEPAGRGPVADEAHGRSGDEERQDECDQAAQQRQPAAVDDVMREPASHAIDEPVEHA